MEHREVAGIGLYFEAEEAETAEVVAKAMSQSVPVLENTWGIAPPEDTQIYIMTSWRDYVFQGIPTQLGRIWATVTLPFRHAQARQMWTMGESFHQSFGRRSVIGIKPSRLVQASSRTAGEEMYLALVYESPERKLEQNTYHELVHASLARINPPMWLNEGLAHLAAERITGEPIIDPATLDALAYVVARAEPIIHYKDLKKEPELYIYYLVRGYWIVRYLDVVHPDVLRDLVSHPYRRTDFLDTMAARLDVPEDQVWKELDATVLAQFAEPVV